MALEAQQFPIFQPSMRLVTAITNDFPALVTTSFDHQYKDGTIVRIDVADGYGMQQIDQKVGEIVVTSPTTFTIDIDTRQFEPFVLPPSYPNVTQFSQVVPVGENNNTLRAAVQNVLPY